MDSSEAFLVIVMIIVSVGAAVSILQSSFNTVMDGELAKGEAEKRMIRKLKKHAIVIGTAIWQERDQEIRRAGIGLCRDSQGARQHRELVKNNVFTVLEHETQPIKALRAAEIDSASMVISAHDKDSENMLMILSARKLRSDIRIITVVNNEDLTETAKKRRRRCGDHGIGDGGATFSHSRPSRTDWSEWCTRR